MKQLTILFLLKDDQILLAMKKRGFGKGRWNGVGGKAEKGETIAAAMVRECQEEIMVKPLNFEKVAEIEFDELHFKERDIMNVHVFTAREWEGEPQETEEMAPKWFKFSQIPYSDMWSDDNYWLPKILAGQKLQCKFTIDDNDQVVAHQISETNTLTIN